MTKSASKMSCSVLHWRLGSLLLLQFYSVIFIITGIWVLVKTNPTVMVSFVVKFANIVVLNIIIIQYSFITKTSNKPSKTYDGKSLVEILPFAIVATAVLDNPSSKTEKICKLLLSDNKLHQWLNTELNNCGHHTQQVAPPSG